MRQIVYTMHFRSQTSPAPDHSVRTNGSATGCVVSTLIQASGVQTELSPPLRRRPLAFFGSELRVTGPDEFEEDGTITFGGDSDHLLRFSTVGQGHVAAGVEPGTIAGTSSWKVNSGEVSFPPRVDSLPRTSRSAVRANVAIFTVCDFSCRNEPPSAHGFGDTSVLVPCRHCAAG